MTCVVGLVERVVWVDVQVVVCECWELVGSIHE